MFVSTLGFWATMLLVVCTSLLPRAVIKYVQQLLFPSDTDLLQETQYIKSTMQEIGALSPQAIKLPVQDMIDKDHVTRSHENLPAIVVEKEEHPTDGFATPTNEDGLPRHKTLSASKKTIHKSSDFKHKVQRASQYFNKHIPHLDSKHKPHRAGSLVYMGTNSKEVANSGFCFSQDEGMQDIITPRRAVLDVIEENAVPKMKKRQPSLVPKLRNLSRSFQTVFGIQVIVKPTSTPHNSANYTGDQVPPEDQNQPDGTTKESSSVPPSTDHLGDSPPANAAPAMPNSRSDNFLSGFKQAFRIPSREHGELHAEPRGLHTHHGHGVKKHHGSAGSIHKKAKKDGHSPENPELIIQVTSPPSNHIENSSQGQTQNSTKFAGPDSEAHLLSTSLTPSLSIQPHDHRAELSQAPQLKIDLPPPELSQLDMFPPEDTEIPTAGEKEPDSTKKD
ncbi:hypothetical protein HDV01_001009 [Terramyces sp. JEL0728]|nr:hypothetical protein HDV01_001009 [Terramyces sp. JEL0728]